MTKGESREADEGREGTAEAKRDRQCLAPESGSIGDSHTGMVRKLAEESESGTISISSV